MTATNQWLGILHRILVAGKPTSPRRGKVGAGDTLEILNCSSMISMSQPVVICPRRKLSHRFACAEAHWILMGDDRVETIAPYAPSIAKFSDDGIRFYGAYGPRISEQVDGVIQKLNADVDTRQAVLSIWRPNPTDSKDIPCTISTQWLIRNGMLHCVDTMRSSDAWLGWPYDVFNFSTLSLYILLELRELGLKLELGTLYLNAGSQHLYDRNREDAEECLKYWKPTQLDDLRPSWFEDSSQLLRYLSAASNGFHLFGIPWLESLIHG